MAAASPADGGQPEQHVAALVVNYGSHVLLEENLVPLSRAVPWLDVTVCDNFSSESEREAIRRLAQRHAWQLVESPNDGFGAGTNRAAERALSAGATHLLLLNPDAMLGAADLDALLRQSAANPDALVAPTILDEDGRKKGAGRYVRLRNGIMTDPRHGGQLDASPGVAPWLTGACLMVPVDLWLRVGGMTEEYFLYWEDVDFSYRAVAAGARLVIAAEASCTHIQGGTQASAPTSTHKKTTTYLYYNARNRLVFAHRNLTPDQQRQWLMSSPRAMVRLIMRSRGRRGAVLRPEGAWSAAARGVRDGIAVVRR